MRITGFSRLPIGLADRTVVDAFGVLFTDAFGVLSVDASDILPVVPLGILLVVPAGWVALQFTR